MGAKTGRLAVSLSGPGIVENRKKMGISIGDINRLLVNVVPAHDVASQIGGLGGVVNNIECEEARPDACHMPFVSICELLNSCQVTLPGGVRPVSCTVELRPILGPLLQSAWSGYDTMRTSLVNRLGGIYDTSDGGIPL